MKKGYKNKGSTWTNDINGAAAESAYAKVTKQYWPASVNTFKAPDVGEEQVRSTCHKNGHLIIYENDIDTDLFVLVITDLPRCKIIGTTLGSTAKISGIWRSDKKEWWVPQRKLDNFTLDKIEI